jgi:tetraacyldisaccharide 4'-kinase
MSIQTWFNGVWYDGSPPPWWLKPGSMLYAAVSGGRRALYARSLRKSVRLGRPVVVVGNLSVGGTGKTPLVCWLARRLSEAGLRPGVVTRGHGGSSRGVRLVGPGDDPAVVGDEALLLARRAAVPVAAGRERAAAAQLLIDVGCESIVSDDGLQHYALVRDCEIVVVDGERRFGNGWLLPAGPLRETPRRLSGVDAIVVNGGTPRDGELGMRLEGTTAVGLLDGGSRLLRDFAGLTVHAVAGIGHPERFFGMLRSHGIAVLGHPLDDHARIGRDDIVFGDDRPVLMTEKDAVKCATMADRRHWYVPVDAHFDDGDERRLLDIVTHAIRVPVRRRGAHG